MSFFDATFVSIGREKHINQPQITTKMTKAQIFTQAHATAKEIRSNFTSYRLAFTAALILTYGVMKNPVVAVVIEKTLWEKTKEHLAEIEGKFTERVDYAKKSKVCSTKLWEKDGKVRLYVAYDKNGQAGYIDLLTGGISPICTRTSKYTNRLNEVLEYINQLS